MARSFWSSTTLRIRTVSGVTDQVSLASLQASVTNAERNGGGWVIFAFHGICDNHCTGTGSMETGPFTEFLDWLATRRDRGTDVRTVADVVANGWSDDQVASLRSRLRA